MWLCENQISRKNLVLELGRNRLKNLEFPKFGTRVGFLNCSPRWVHWLKCFDYFWIVKLLNQIICLLWYGPIKCQNHPKIVAKCRTGYILLNSLPKILPCGTFYLYESLSTRFYIMTLWTSLNKLKFGYVGFSFLLYSLRLWGLRW